MGRLAPRIPGQRSRGPSAGASVGQSPPARTPTSRRRPPRRIERTAGRRARAEGVMSADRPAVIVIGKGPAVVTTRQQADTLGRLLLRPTFDPRTSAGSIAHDSLIVAMHVSKVYADDHDAPGADVDLYTVRNCAQPAPYLPPVYYGRTVLS